MSKLEESGPGLRAPDTELGVCVGWATSLATHASVSLATLASPPGGTSDPLCVIRGQKGGFYLSHGQMCIPSSSTKGHGASSGGLGRLSPSDTPPLLQS